MALNLTASVELPCGADRARSELGTLEGYPSWLGIVSDVVVAEPDDGDPGPAWWVDLGGKIGAIRKTKRVRMVRSVCTDDLIRFERHELDARTHNTWMLEARVHPSGQSRTGIEMKVHYSGERRVPVLDAVLRAEVRRAGRRLIEVVQR